MFKVGDIVRCKEDKYGITTYKRPCEIMEILSDEKIYVRCLGGDSSIYDVYTDLFELVPLDEVLYKGMYVKDDEGELCKFIGYRENSIIVSHPKFGSYPIGYDDIRYIKKFIV